MLCERGAGPLPKPPHSALTGECFTISSHSDRVPVVEANIGTLQVGEKPLRAFTILQRLRWRTFFYPVVDEMSAFH